MVVKMMHVHERTTIESHLMLLFISLLGLMRAENKYQIKNMILRSMRCVCRLLYFIFLLFLTPVSCFGIRSILVVKYCDWFAIIIVVVA